MWLHARIALLAWLRRLDGLLHDGFHVGEVSEIVGPTAVGKTQMCLFVTAGALLRRDPRPVLPLSSVRGAGSNSASPPPPALHRVVYVDCSGTFSASRLETILCERLMGGEDGPDAVGHMARGCLGRVQVVCAADALTLWSCLEEVDAACGTASHSTSSPLSPSSLHAVDGAAGGAVVGEDVSVAAGGFTGAGGGDDGDEAVGMRVGVSVGGLVGSGGGGGDGGEGTLGLRLSHAKSRCVCSLLELSNVLFQHLNSCVVCDTHPRCVLCCWVAGSAVVVPSTPSPLQCSLLIVDCVAAAVTPILGSADMPSGHALVTAIAHKLQHIASAHGVAVLVWRAFVLVFCSCLVLVLCSAVVCLRFCHIMLLLIVLFLLPVRTRCRW